MILIILSYTTCQSEFFFLFVHATTDLHISGVEVLCHAYDTYSLPWNYGNSQLNQSITAVNN